MRTILCAYVIALNSWLAWALPSTVPALSVRTLNPANIRLAWPAGATGYVLEETDRLGAPWRSVTQTPGIEASEFAVTVPTTGSSQFFRLRHVSFTATTIAETSPANGETGVAVTRETIIRFSAPLAADTALSTNHFFAGYGGRRLLARIELATDRRKATLFYLEPLPGATRVSVVFDSNGLTDFQGRPLDVADPGQTDGIKLFHFETLSLTPVGTTAVSGRVLASELVPGPDTGTNAVNKPLAGVTITVDGMEETLRTVTDAQGNFVLQPVPPGRFFVHIDGRTVADGAAGIRYPDQSYYPFVGKAWEAVVGRTNLAGGTGEIFLPLIKTGTLRAVSVTEDTAISFPANIISNNPALAGVSITVPANSLFSDDGVRGGMVGIAPVPPDRLPEPLPPGLEMPIVITVQTDGGLNFDRPAPICFPNLPDPVLKTPLPAGSKQALVSFNHDKGIWEAVGTMTVSSDGKLVCTDPGSGILQPGWHGVSPPPEEPPPPPPPPAAPGLPPLPDPDKCGRSFPKYEGCLGTCDELEEGCMAQAAEYLEQLRDDCAARFPDEKERRDFCLEMAEGSYKIAKLDCTLFRSRCGSVCQYCYGSGTGAGPTGLQASATSTADQILAIIEQISELLFPFTSTSTPIPDEVQNQIDDLERQADALAGGDRIAFLRSHIIAVEERAAAGARALELARDDLRPGNAPSYPVLYAAEISRPNGRFTLRGETGAYGYYQLFVPRDGELLSVSFYDSKTKGFGFVLPNLSSNAPYRLPRFELAPLPGEARDLDQDGLPDLVEVVCGTDLTKKDSDGDGIPDGTEMDQGANPLDGRPTQTAVIATARTTGTAIDVWAGNDLVVTAEGTSGVSLFSTFDGGNPTLFAHLPTSGNVQRVSGTESFIVAAAGDAGLLIIDAGDPRAARMIHQVPMPGAQSIVAVSGKAYVGFTSGSIASVDLATGTVLDYLTLTNAVWDLAVAGEHLYALSDNRLVTISLAQNGFAMTSAVEAPSSPSAPTRNRRLFVGGGIAYTVHGRGYNTFDLADPARPALLATGNTTQTGWMQIVPNGSGIGLAAVGPNGAPNDSRDVSLYDLGDPRTNDVFLTTFVTPGIARAVAIYNGLAYAADDTAGLQVINYLPYDANGLPPVISLAPGFSTNGVAEGSSLFVSADIADDVQVRNVEFFLNGERVFNDGSFPFEFRFRAPALSQANATFRLSARAFDTGGNSRLSAEIVVPLLADTIPPQILNTSPLGGAKSVTQVIAFFSEPISVSTNSPAPVQLFSAGPDQLPGTADDIPVAGGRATNHVEIVAAGLEFSAPLSNGLYRAVIPSSITDLAGNRFATGYEWSFRVEEAVFWVRSVDGSWHNPLNWSGGALPGTNDHVYFDPFEGDLTVNFGAGITRVRGLTVNESMRLVFSGTLQISETIEVNENLLLDSATIQGGAIRQNGDARLIFTNRVATLDGVSVNGDLVLTNAGARLAIRNGLSLSGAIRLNNAAIGFLTDQTLDNTTVIFEGDSGFLSVDGNSTLTLGTNLVVRGKTGIITGGMFSGGIGFPKLINRGLITTDIAGGQLNIAVREFQNAGTVRVTNANSLTISSLNWTNSAQIEAGGAASITFDGQWNNSGMVRIQDSALTLGGQFTLAGIGEIERLGGTVTLTGQLNLNGGTLTLNAASGPLGLRGGTIRNGTVTQNAEAKLLFSNFGGFLESLQVNGDLDLTSSGSGILIRSNLTLNGTVRLNNGFIAFTGTQTFDTTTVLFEGNAGTLSVEGDSTLTLGPNLIIRGRSGTIRSGLFSDTGARRIINRGTIASDIPGGALLIVPNQFENAGTLRADGASTTVTIRVPGFVNTGEIEELNGGRVLVNP